MVCKSAVSERGFGFQEMVLCLGIMLVLGTAALPKAVNMDVFYVRQETAYLVDAIRFLQAWGHSFEYCVDTYHHYGRSRAYLYFPSGQNYYYLRHNSYAVKKRLPENGVKITSNRMRIYFHERGLATNTTIKVTKGNYEESVIIDVVGRVRVERARIWSLFS